MEIVVTGIGLISTLGTLETTWQQLLAGQSGISLHQPFAELKRQPLALVNQAISPLAELTQQAVKAALQDANLIAPLNNCGIVVGSSRSHQTQWENLARLSVTESEQLTHWLGTLPHTPAIAVARQVGATGPVLAPMAACATGLWAIAQGFELLQTHQCQQVIAGAVEAPITPLTLAGFEQMGVLAQTSAYPFDVNREGLVLGEGAAVLVLESIESARQRSARIYGKILGCGLTADGYHVSSPAPSQRGAIAAVRQCLERSQLSLETIDYIHAHGTATQLNDRHEAHLIQHLFPQGVPVSSTKGATGHTLGASGALGASFCLMALKHQVLPPCVGVNQPEFDLDLVRMARQTSVQHALCFSFGFGGQNAVLAFSNH